MGKKYTQKDAITLINKISLAGAYVLEERTDYKTYSNELLLYLTQFIKKKSKRSKDYKIIYALYKTQVKKNGRDFKHSARGELIRILCKKLKYIPWDKDKTEQLKNKILPILKKYFNENKFTYEYCLLGNVFELKPKIKENNNENDKKIENNYKINFLIDNAEKLLDFGKKIAKGKIEISEMIEILNEVQKYKYTEKEAIIVITNLTLAQYYVNYKLTTFHYYCGKSLLYAAQFINTEGSLNYKIIYALYKSQFDEKTQIIKKNAKSEVINVMINKFSTLDEKDTVLAGKIEKVIIKAFRKDTNSEFFVFSRLIDIFQKNI